MCGERLPFLYISPCEHVEYNVPRLSTFVLKKYSERIHPRLNIVIRA